MHCWAALQSVHGLRCYDNIMQTPNVSEYVFVLALCPVLSLPHDAHVHSAILTWQCVCLSVRLSVTNVGILCILVKRVYKRLNLPDHFIYAAQTDRGKWAYDREMSNNLQRPKGCDLGHLTALKSLHPLLSLERCAEATMSCGY